MSGTRLVQQNEATPFPYDAAKEAVLALPKVEVHPMELGRMIEVGKRIGWSKELLDGHEALRAGGRCFTFRQNVPPWLRGTFYEDNVFFEFANEQQEAEMRPFILELATRLQLKVLEY
ncbi:MAG: hypothetical protein IPJ65_24960 [Archangiaceae bacterium]|nr:hypothetical protein [Archangiaceae bacterium]